MKEHRSLGKHSVGLIVPLAYAGNIPSRITPYLVGRLIFLSNSLFVESRYADGYRNPVMTELMARYDTTEQIKTVA